MKEMNILLVEDNEDDRFLITRGLKKLPYKVRIETVKDGAEALERLLGMNRQMPSLILLDLQMPKIDGKEVLSRLRSTPATSKIPIMILTASDNSGDMDSCHELGADGYLNKPLDVDQLFGMIRNIAPQA